MDNHTSEFYNRYANEGSIQGEAAQSAASAYFGRAFKAGGKVLDVGAGSGRDLAMLHQLGFDAYGLEPNVSMRSYTLRTHPALMGRVQGGTLPVLGLPFGGGFDGILCSAVLMHIAPADLPQCAQSLRAIVVPGARLLFTLPCMHPNLLNGDRDPDGRFFTNHKPENLALHLEKTGFSLIESWDNGEHANTRWQTLLFELPNP